MNISETSSIHLGRVCRSHGLSLRTIFYFLSKKPGQGDVTRLVSVIKLSLVRLYLRPITRLSLVIYNIVKHQRSFAVQSSKSLPFKNRSSIAFNNFLARIINFKLFHEKKFPVEVENICRNHTPVGPRYHRHPIPESQERECKKLGAC